MASCRKKDCVAYEPHITHKGVRPSKVPPLAAATALEGQDASELEVVGGDGNARDAISLLYAGALKRRRVDDDHIPRPCTKEDKKALFTQLEGELNLGIELERLENATADLPSLRGKITPTHVRREAIPAFGSECSAETFHIKAEYEVTGSGGTKSALHLDAYSHSLRGRGACDNGEHIAKINASIRGHELKFLSAYLFADGDRNRYSGKATTSGVKKFFLALADALGAPVDPTELLEVLVPKQVLRQTTPDPYYEERRDRNEISTVKEDLLLVAESGRDLASDWREDG